MRYCCTYFTLIRTHIVHGCPKLALMKQKNFPTVISAHKKNTLDLSGVIFVDFGPRRRLRQWHWSIRSGGMEQNQVEVFACLRLILGTWGVSPLEVSSFLWEGIQYVRKIYMGTFMPLHHRRHRRGLKTWFYRSGGSHSYDYSFFTMCVGRRAEWNTLRGIEDSTREALKNWLPTVASYPMMLCYICEMDGWLVVFGVKSNIQWCWGRWRWRGHIHDSAFIFSSMGSLIIFRPFLSSSLYHQAFPKAYESCQWEFELEFTITKTIEEGNGAMRRQLKFFHIFLRKAD